MTLDQQLLEKAARSLGIPVEELLRTEPSDLQAPTPRPRMLWSIVTRRLPSTPAPWSNPDVEELVDQRIRLAAPAVPRLIVSHTHPAVRRTAAELLDRPEPLAQLLDDPWREVRMTAVMNPATPRDALEERAARELAAPIREAIERRLRDSPDEGDDRPLTPCVECGRRTKRPDFFTCSVACSIDQYGRRCHSGAWADAIRSDYRHQHGFRDEWPASYSWEVAAAPGSGGLPGAGPRKRTVLVSFVRGVDAGTLVPEVQRACAAGVSGPHVIAVLERLADHLDDPDGVRVAVDAMIAEA